MLRLNSEREKLFDWIIEALSEMPNLPRQAFILGHYQGLSSEEIATRIGAEQQDIRFLLRRANTVLYERVSALVPREKGRKVLRPEIADQVGTGQDLPALVGCPSS